MKAKIQILVTLIMVLAVSAAATTPKNETTSKIDWAKAEQNYIAALHSTNLGVMQSAAVFVGEYQLSGAENNLINLLENNKIEQIRMSAALALIKMGTAEGRKAVEDASIYDGSEKVAKFCEQLINSASSDISSR